MGERCGKIPAELKARRHQMRSAGHYWSQHEADRFLTDPPDTGDIAAEAFIVVSMTAREPLLRSIGAGEDDVRDWQAACRKSFASRIAAYRERQERRQRHRDLRSAMA